MPANRGEHVDQLARLGQSELAILGGVAAEPSHRRALISERVVVADQEHEAERVGEADVSELGRGGEREVRVAGLERALELGVSVSLRRHLTPDDRTPS